MKQTILFFLLSISIALNAQKLPKLPTEPKVPEVSNEERDNRGDKKSEEAKSKQSRDVLVILCDGRKVKGKWEEKDSELNITHIKDGIKYQKKIMSANMLSVKVLSWKAILFKEEKDGTSYKMVPSNVRIETRSGESYEKDMGLDGTEYSILKVENDNGITTIYSLWMDFLAKDGTWFTKLEKISPDKERKDCFKEVLVELKFLN
jgi:small nuclear ribonucleoprotein (snRNP)-like protein